MGNNNILYFLAVLALICSCFLYKERLKNDRLYKICQDQDDTIQLQLEAISSQRSYISKLKDHYNNNLIYNRNSYDDYPFSRSPENPIH